MRLYLDEDLASHELVRVLIRAAHDVATPRDAGLLGESDVVQLTRATQDDRITITANYGDFEELHDLVLKCGGSHPGIFAIRTDNNPRRDLKLGQIIHAIGNVSNVLASVRNHFLCLNEWR